MLELFPKAVSIYQYGSSTLPFLKNPNDIDYIVVFNTEKDVKSSILPTNEKCGFHYLILVLNHFNSTKKYKNLLKTKKEPYNQVHDSFDLYRGFAPFAVKLMLHWATLLEGKDINIQSLFDLSDPDTSNILLEGLIQFKNDLQFIRICGCQTLKHWYQLYLCACIYANNSFELNEKEIETINNLHDLTACEADYILLISYIESLR